MKQHFVYFYGSTKIISGHNSLQEDAIRKRNQIIGFDGIDVNPELIEYGETCFNKVCEDGSKGETGTMYPKNITIVPFRYMYKEELIIRHLEDVLIANENYIKADSIGFPLMMLKSATNEGYNQLGKDWSFSIEQEKELRNKWCCFGHYYLSLLKKALYNKGYTASGVSPNDKIGNLINTNFLKADGTRLIIHAVAGL
jgi:hypothetical protein